MKRFVLYNQCLQGTNSDTTYMVKDDLLFWKGWLVIPANQAVKIHIMNEFHASKIGGHLV